MRIVHVITKGDVGGAQTHVVELATAQQEAGDDVVVIAGSDGPAMGRLRTADVSVIVLESLARARPWRPRSALRELAEALESIAPQVVHGHSSVGGLLSRWAAWRRGYASVYTAHGWPFQPGAAPSQRVVSWCGELVGGRIGGGVICLTEAEAALARRWRVARRDSVWVVPNGLHDVPAMLRRPARGDGPVRIVMVARFAPPKMQSELVQVLSTLPEGDWSVTFVGDGPDLPACRELAAKLLGGRAEFLGDRDDVEQLLPTADVLVLWSRYEGLPISMLEGMRAGLCCVGSALPGVTALFGSADTGLAAADTGELRRVLGALTGDRRLCDRYGAAARVRYESSHTIDAMRDRTRQAYEQILRSRHDPLGEARLPSGGRPGRRKWRRSRG
jgi:glycosyltransferase involved in cell wall biosynthesis